MKIDPEIFEELKLFFNRKGAFLKEKLNVISAYSLTSTDKELLLLSLKKLGPKEDSINYLVDKNILAGVILRTGSTIIDLSLHGQLLNLKQELYEST